MRRTHGIGEWLVVAFAVAVLGGCVAALCHGGVVQAGRGFPRSGRAVAADPYWHDTETVYLDSPMESTNAARQLLDLSGNGIHFSAIGGLSLEVASTNAYGRVEHCLDLDGTSGYATNGFAVLPATGPWTISLWVSVDQPSRAAIEAYFAQYTSAGAGNAGRIALLEANTRTNQFELLLGDDGAQGTKYVNWLKPSGTNWYHLAAERDGNVFRLYGNGSLAGTLTDAGTRVLSQAPPTIGAAWGTSVGTLAWPFDGRVDNLRVYQTNIGPQAVSNLYTYTHPTNCMVYRP